MSETGTRLLPANVTLLQPGSRGYRLSDALTVAAMTQQVSNVTLQGQVTENAANITALQGYVTALQGQVQTLQGQVTTLQGQVSTLQTQVANLIAFMNSFNYVQLEVSTGRTFLDNRNIYVRSFVITGATNTALQVFTYAHGVPNINYIAEVQAMASQQGGQQLPITFVNLASAPNITVGLGAWADTTNIYISTGNAVFTNYLVLVRLYYTATDR